MRGWTILSPILLFAAVPITRAQTAAPLPNVEQLRQRAVANHARVEEAKERYLCRELVTTHELDGKGRDKKTETRELEVFFVKGHEIRQEITRNGKPLSDSEQRKQTDEVRKAIEHADKEGRAHRGEGEVGAGDFLRLATLSNERRVLVSNRPTILFDAHGNEDAKVGGMADRFIRAMAGTIAIDEATGTPQDIELHGIKDVKLGGGLLMNVHKGFYGHIVFAPQPDGVWLVNRAYGSGDARLGLLLHPAGRFEQRSEGCKLTNVASESVDKRPEGK